MGSALRESVDYNSESQTAQQSMMLFRAECFQQFCMKIKNTGGAELEVREDCKNESLWAGKLSPKVPKCCWIQATHSFNLLLAEHFLVGSSIARLLKIETDERLPQNLCSRGCKILGACEITSSSIIAGRSKKVGSCTYIVLYVIRGIN